MKNQLLILFFCFLSISSDAIAQSIQWNQPEVVPEKLARQNRRVLKLSGTARVGTQIRVRENKVKMIYSAQKIRWARIPQKHRVQFPVIASDTGYFSFELYLPTVPVEIPLEVFKGGKWVPYRFSFEVPQDGAADDFKFVEESFKVRKDEENVKVEDFLAEYDKDEDRGQVVNDRGEWKSWVTGKVIVWGSLGFTYFSLKEDVNGIGSFGGLSFPYWEIGGEYRWDPQWKVDLAYMNRPGKAETDGITMENTDMEWSEFRAYLSYSPPSWESEAHRWSVKGGLQMHDLPYIKRTGGGPPQDTYRVFNNNVIYLAAGLGFETMRAKQWNYEASGLLLYPVSVDNEFDMKSSYGLNLGFSLFKEVIPALMMGAKIDAHWLSFTAEHAEFSNSTMSVSADTNLWQITPSFLIKAEF